METIKDWLATGGVMLGVLMLCGWLDEPPTPTACVASVTDGGGNTHYISGQVAPVSTD